MASHASVSRLRCAIARTVLPTGSQRPGAGAAARTRARSIEPAGLAAARSVQGPADRSVVLHCGGGSGGCSCAVLPLPRAGSLSGGSARSGERGPVQSAGHLRRSEWQGAAGDAPCSQTAHGVHWSAGQGAEPQLPRCSLSASDRASGNVGLWAGLGVVLKLMVSLDVPNAFRVIHVKLTVGLA